MALGKCNECLFWKDGLCNKKGTRTERTFTCDEWISREDPKEKEKLQLANSYIPSPWDEWKKQALKRQDQLQKNWEI